MFLDTKDVILDTKGNPNYLAFMGGRSTHQPHTSNNLITLYSTQHVVMLYNRYQHSVLLLLLQLESGFVRLSSVYQLAL